MSHREIADAAEQWMRTHGHVSHDEIDCSHFVTAVLQASVAPGFAYLTADGFLSSGLFTRVDQPARGDLVHWPGHVAIILDPIAGTFIGSQSSTGVDVANYKYGPYWARRQNRVFLRYVGH